MEPLKRFAISIGCVILLVSIASAINIDFQVWASKPYFYDNETVELQLNITNYDISMAASNAVIIINTTKGNYAIPLGTIKPNNVITKNLSLDKFDAGTYRIEYYLEHDFLGVVDRTQVQYQNIKVLLSVPIEMKTYTIKILTLDMPENIKINEKFDIKFRVNSSSDEGYVISSLDGGENKHDLTKGLQELKDTFTVEKTGLHVFELKVYSKEENTSILRDYLSKTFVISNPDEFQKIVFTPIEKKKGEITVEVSKTNRTFIDEIGCFLVGGCTGDLVGPEITSVELERTGDVISSVTIVADDSNSGESIVSACSISINKGASSLMTETGSESNGVRKTYTKDLNSNMDSIDLLSFTCTDEQWNTGLYSYELSKKKGSVKIHVSDGALKKDIYNCEVYIDGNLKGFTDYNGIFEIGLYVGGHSLKLKARGYNEQQGSLDVNENQTTDQTFDLTQSYETRFQPPQGYEKWTTANKAAGTQIHPLEERLRSYSYPLYSTEKIDVVKDLIDRIDKYLTYDDRCWPELKPGCTAWHDSDYKVIETGKGVCYDWATLGVSFTDSYGIPARYNRGCWTTVDMFGKEKVSCHAWQQVYLEGKGWVHMDTLWDQFDNPCVYSKQSTVICFSAGAYYDPETNTDIPVDTYDCGKSCENTATNKENLQKPLEDWGQSQEYRYNVVIRNQNCAIEFKKKANENEAGTFRHLRDNNSLSQENIVNYFNALLGRFNVSKTQMQLVIDESDSNALWIGVNFTTDCDESHFKDNFISDQYTTIYYTISAKDKPVFVTPNPTKITDKTYSWVFDRPGEKNIELQFAKAKYGFIVPEDPVKKIIGQTIASNTGGSILTSDNVGVYSKIFILGAYTEIPSSVENRIKESGQGVQRLTDNTEALSIKLALMFYQEPEVVVVSTPYDYGSIETAAEYAIKNRIPLILTDGRDGSTILSSLAQLKLKKIMIADPSNKITAEFIGNLNKIAKVEYLNVESKDNPQLVITERQKTAVKTGGVSWLLYVALVLIICGIILVWHMRGRYRKK